MTAQVAVVGYTTLEHSLVVADSLSPDRTAIVLERPAGHSGRPGGCAAHIAHGLADHGVDVIIATRVGEDPVGADLAEALRRKGVDVSAVERRGVTPTVWMIYGPHGDGWCLYDPAGGMSDPLTDPQRAAVASASWCVVAVGPHDATAGALDALAPDQRLLWSVKADSRSWPAGLVRRLAERADVIMLSDSERDWVEGNLGVPLESRLRAGTLLVETQGRRGMRWSVDGRSGSSAPAGVVEVSDTSGAGDWAVAGLLAALLQGAEPSDATRAAGESAVALLRARSHSSAPPERRVHS